MAASGQPPLFTVMTWPTLPCCDSIPPGRRRLKASSGSSFPIGFAISTLASLELNQFDSITVRIFNERDFGAAELHRARLPHDFSAFGPQRIAGLVDIAHADREMAEGVAEIVLVGVPVV